MDGFSRILVAGGAGFIGSNYVRLALQKHPGRQIVVFDKLTYAGNLENLRGIRNHIEFLHGDIADRASVRNAMVGVEAVLNFAAESDVDRSLQNPDPFVRTNVEGTLVLLEEAHRASVKRFLQVSTDEVYGDLSGTSRHSLETDNLAPSNPYAATKAGAEFLAFSYRMSHGLDVVVTRGSNSYGPYQYPEKIIPLFVTNALEGNQLPLYGDGTAVRDYLHVEDHCSGIDLVLQRGLCGHVYNLGARLEVSGLRVAEMILALLGKPADLARFVADRPAHDYRYSVDPSKAETLGWTRIRDFAEGLEATIAWYRENTEWWRKLKARGQ